MQYSGSTMAGQHSRQLQPLSRRRCFASQIQASTPSVQQGSAAHRSRAPCADVQPGQGAWQSCRHSSVIRRRGLAIRPASTVSGIPFPGDDQGALMFTVLETRPDDIEGVLGLDYSEELHGGAAVEAAGEEPPPEKGIQHRWQVVFMMAAAFVLCNMDKVNMSVAVIPMAEELGWSALDRGLVNSAFFWGYSLTQIPAGWVSTKIGGARVLLVGVALWSLGTLMAPPAAKMGLLALCATRVFVGLGEGLAPSSATTVMAKIIPESERARAVTTVFGSLDVGAALGLVICGPLIRAAGWPSVFYAFAAIGLLWCLLWPLLQPEKSEHATPAPAVAAASPNGSATHDGAKSQPGVPWGVFLRTPAVWAINVAHFSFNFGYYTLMAWLPSYFELALGLNVQKSSLLTLIPYLAMMAMTPFVGPVADGLVKKGWSITHVRKLSQGIAFAGPALCMIACGMLSPGPAGVNPTVTAAIVALLSVSFALGAWSRGGLYCNHQDLSPKYAGALLGLSNTFGAFPGILGVTSVGFLLDRTSSWGTALFFPCAICQLIGLVVYTTFASSERRQDWA